MLMAQTPFLLFGLSVGVIAAEAAWQAVGPFMGTQQSAPPMRTAIAMFAIFGSAALLVALGNLSDDTTPSSYWVNAIAACLGGQIWLAFKTFAQLTSGRLAQVMRLTVLLAHSLTGPLLFALIGAVLLGGIGSSRFHVLTLGFGAAASLGWVRRARTEFAGRS
jgi:hypothetical protein